MKRRWRMHTLFLVLMVIGLSVQAFAQAPGILTGRVTDAQSGDYLPGANVMLDGTNIGGVTDREGSFRIGGVPAGDYTVIVRYIGYDEYSAAVTVAAGATATLDVPLSVGYIEMDNVVVEGIRQGQVKALAMQRESANIKNVVSREQMEQFPDVNVADVLQRVPGVYISRTGGEGRYVLIRGTEPRLSSITFNGAPLATSRQEERYAQLDIVGSNQMAFVEVVKALTPDMDANSIGGNVNVITRSAFDYPGRKIRATLGGGYAELDGKTLWQGKLNFNDRFGADKNIGVTFTANFDQKTRGADNLEYEWDEEEDVNNNVIPFALGELHLMDFQNIRTRTGIGGGVEYRLNEDHRFYTNVSWNKYADDAARGRTRMRINKGDYLNADGTLTEKSRIYREHKYRVEDQFQSYYSFGGEHNLGANELDYNFAYSYAAEEHLPQLESEWEFDEKVDLSLDLADPNFPKWDILDIDPVLQNDASMYYFDNFDYRDQKSTNTQMAGGLNFQMPLNIAGWPVNLKVGGKYTGVVKDRDDDRMKYEWEGENDFTMDQLLSDREREDFMDDNYTFGPQVDHESAMDFLEANKDSFSVEVDVWDSEGQTYTVNENVMAYYAMANVNLGKIKLLGGFRHEITNNNFIGNEITWDDQGDLSGIEEVDLDRDYGKIFPMFHVVGDVTPNTKLRLAYTSTMSRPNYWDQAPFARIRYNKEEVELGNPDIKPTYANNIDLIAEHYLPGIGLASGSFFYKDLTDIIFVQTSSITEGDMAGFDLEQAVNGGDATLFGYELNWQQELTFLPGALSGLGIYANYTHTWADAELTERSGYLPGQAGDAGNFALSYEMGKFKARLSFAYQSEFITEVGKDEDHDEYTHAHSQLDFTSSYEVIDNLEIFLDMVNLNNAPDLEYMGIADRPIKMELYSWWARFGVKWTL